MTVTDGPFAETKELIGGFAILEAASKDEAIRLGEQFNSRSAEPRIDIRAVRRSNKHPATKAGSAGNSIA